MSPLADIPLAFLVKTEYLEFTFIKIITSKKYDLGLGLT